MIFRQSIIMKIYPCPGEDSGFQVRGGGALKKLRRAEEGAKIVQVFRVKNYDFTPILFSPILGGRAPGATPPPGSAPASKRSTIRDVARYKMKCRHNLRRGVLGAAYGI